MNEENLFSFSREAMLKRCPREFYLHTVYAFGEYEVGAADSERNHVHLLKQLRSVQSFKEALLLEVFRKIFIDGLSFYDLKRILLKEFFAAKNDMLLGFYETDHLQSPILSEFYYDEVNIGDFFSEIADELDSAAGNLLGNDLFCHLFEAPRQDFYPSADVASVHIGNIKIYFPLLGVINRAGEFFCLNFCNHAEYYETSAVLDLFYCQQKLHISPEFVRHVFINDSGMIRLENDNSKFNISTVLDDIARRADSHLNIAHELQTVTDPFSIPSANDNSLCTTCRFREFCMG